MDGGGVLVITAAIGLVRREELRMLGAMLWRRSGVGAEGPPAA